MTDEPRPPVDLLDLDIAAHEVADLADGILAHLRRSDLTRGGLTPARARSARAHLSAATRRLLEAGTVLDHRART